MTKGPDYSHRAAELVFGLTGKEEPEMVSTVVAFLKNLPEINDQNVQMEAETLIFGLTGKEQPETVSTVVAFLSNL